MQAAEAAGRSCLHYIQYYPILSNNAARLSNYLLHKTLGYESRFIMLLKTGRLARLRFTRAQDLQSARLTECFEAKTIVKKKRKSPLQPLHLGLTPCRGGGACVSQ